MAAIIGSEYCTDTATDIRVVASVLPVGDNRFFVTDINNNIIFRVNDSSTTFHKQRSLLDSDGNIIVTFRPKSMSMHYRWIAYRGDSTNKKDIIFSAKNHSSSMFSSKKDLFVFLPNNDHDDSFDFKVDSSFVFHKAHSDNIVIAEAQGKEHTVKVRANIDKAFIVSLIVVLDGIKEMEAETRKAGLAAAKAAT